MISHKYKCIFIHIPKCAGSSVFKFLSDNTKVDWKKPNYDLLYGWCPERKLHLQHATAKQLLDTGLISKTNWESYTKFTIVRNPWDRALSDYVWIKKDTKTEGSFNDFINKTGNFTEVLTNNEDKKYRGDHLLNQTDFFDFEGKYSVDKIIRFENLNIELPEFFKTLDINKIFENIHEKKSIKKIKHYSHFFTKSKRRLIEINYNKDINQLEYSFKDRKSGLQIIKNYF